MFNNNQQRARAVSGRRDGSYAAGLSRQSDRAPSPVPPAARTRQPNSLSPRRASTATGTCTVTPSSAARFEPIAQRQRGRQACQRSRAVGVASSTRNRSARVMVRSCGVQCRAVCATSRQKSREADNTSSGIRSSQKAAISAAPTSRITPGVVCRFGELRRAARRCRRRSDGGVRQSPRPGRERMNSSRSADGIVLRHSRRDGRVSPQRQAEERAPVRRPATAPRWKASQRAVRCAGARSSRRPATRSTRASSVPIRAAVATVGAAGPEQVSATTFTQRGGGGSAHQTGGQHETGVPARRCSLRRCRPSVRSPTAGEAASGHQWRRAPVPGRAFDGRIDPRPE